MLIIVTNQKTLSLFIYFSSFFAALFLHFFCTFAALYYQVVAALIPWLHPFLYAPGDYYC
jgi:hypothetical protein